MTQSDADRARAYRERKREERDSQSEMAEQHARYLGQKERYLLDAAIGARLAAAERRLPPKDAELRVERALKYARWRWEGFHRGEIAAL